MGERLIGKTWTIYPVEPETPKTPYEEAVEKAGLVYVSDYVMHPQRYLILMNQWTTEDQRGHLNWDDVITVARRSAENLADRYRGTGHGFGSSDHTYEMMEFLEGIGFIVGWVKHPKWGTVGSVIGRTQHRVGWKDGIEDEPLDFFGPCENWSAGWARIKEWRKAERAKPDFDNGEFKDFGVPAYFFRIQVLFDHSHRYPGFEGVESR